MNQQTAEETVRPSGGRVALYWAIVLIPLAYGIYNTILKSVPLFG